jgi:hypothetical protein
LFTQSFAWAIARSFPLSKHTVGGDTAPAFSACMFIYSSCGKWVFPPLLWSFPSSTILTSFPTPGCCACDPAPAGASLARPGLFIYSSRNDSPPPCSGLRVPHPLSYVSLLFLLLITQFLFFSCMGVSLSRGLCRSGPGLSVGVLYTT